jgi:membrane protein implicated in regulation of membrane protease activity
MISDLFGGVHPSILWGVLAIILAITEMVLPGVFLIWLAIAAALTAGLASLLPVSEPFQLLAFAIFSALTVSGGRLWYLARPVEGNDPLLNHRAERMVGEQVEVVEAIAHGRGRVRVGDGVWSARGADAAVGSQVRIVGAQGAELLVEPVEP